MLGAKSDIAAATARLYAEQSCALTLAARETISLEKIKEDLLIRGAVNIELAEVNLESVKSIKTFLKTWILFQTLSYVRLVTSVSKVEPRKILRKWKE